MRHSNRDWKSDCKASQSAWKAQTQTLPDPARARGYTWVEAGGKKPRRVGPFTFCLPEPFASWNLMEGVRAEALARFKRHKIRWHAEHPGHGGPSTHLTSSQVQCVNILLSLAIDPSALLRFARLAEPDAEGLMEVEDGSLVAFEWCGLDNHLGEWRGKNWRRGEFVTSADALLLARRRDGITAILVEWKLVEDGRAQVSNYGSGGTDRRAVYEPALQRSPLAGRLDVEQTLCAAPHYQLLRLALLGSEMIRAREFDVDRAVVLHACPSTNLRQLDIPLRGVAESNLPGAWRSLLPDGGLRYVHLDTLPWFSGTEALAERYGALAMLGA